MMCLRKTNREETSSENKGGKNWKDILDHCMWGITTPKIRRALLRSYKKISGQTLQTATNNFYHTTFRASSSRVRA